MLRSPQIGCRRRQGSREQGAESRGKRESRSDRGLRESRGAILVPLTTSHSLHPTPHTLHPFFTAPYSLK
ncbi:hypothetical protein [Chroococcidiopsis sp.]|uniref:hypothetical protein n=1 Tax=Chroococcidiopsis sp. TaxID=3088168 RepID=UPI003F2D42C8